MAKEGETGWASQAFEAVIMAVIAPVLLIGYYAFFFVFAVAEQLWGGRRRPTAARPTGLPPLLVPIKPQAVNRRLEPVGGVRSYRWGCLSSATATAVSVADPGSIWERQDIAGPERFYRVLARSSWRPDPAEPWYEAAVELQPLREVEDSDAPSDWRAGQGVRLVPRDLYF